jgi:hypothetical protein
MGLLADDDDQYIATVRVNELHGGKLGEDCSNSLEASKDLAETLWNLRNVYLSIDFDILLWDSLSAIHNLTELNQLQLQRSLPCFLVSRQDEE